MFLSYPFLNLIDSCKNRKLLASEVLIMDTVCDILHVLHVLGQQQASQEREVTMSLLNYLRDIWNSIYLFCTSSSILTNPQGYLLALNNRPFWLSRVTLDPTKENGRF